MSTTSLSAEERNVWTQILRFLCTGLMSYVIDTGTLWFSSRVLHCPLLIATTAGFLVSFAFNYGLGRLWVFKTSQPAGPQIARYGILVGVNYALTLVMMSVFTTWGLSLIPAKTIAVAINAVINFTAGRYWVYR